MASVAPWEDSRRRLRAAAGLALALLISPAAARAQAPGPCERAVLTLSEAAELLRIDADALRRLAEEHALPGRRVESSWRFSCAALMAWLEGERLTPEALAHVRGRGAVATPAQSGGEPAPTGAQPQPVGEAPEERAAEDVFLRGQRVLLGRGEVVLDFGQFYSRSDDYLLASVGGAIGLTTVERRIFTSLVVGRVGVFAETELFASATFVSQRNDQFIGNTELAGDRHSAFGGTNVGVRRTLLRESPRRPDIIASVSGYIPAGGRSRAVGAGLVFVKSVDPVVLFAGANYLHTFGQDASNDRGLLLAPQDRFDVSMGYGLALNDTLAISMSVAGLFAGSRARDAAPRQPDVFVGRMGLTSWVTRGLYVEPSVSFALTGPGRSVAFGVTMPYAF